MKFAFISRYAPTPIQKDMASKDGHTLTHVKGADIFSVTPEFISSHGTFDGIVTVHAAAAMRLAPQFAVGVFVGDRTQYAPESFQVYDLRINHQG